jgi:WD40 repeat protein
MSIRHLATVLVVLWMTRYSIAAAPAVVRKDRLGDPLPPGAIARLGSMRLRNQGLLLWLAVSPDGSKVASLDFPPATRLRLWDRATGRLLSDWDFAETMSLGLSFTPDGKGLLSCHYHVWSWDLGTGKRKRWGQEDSAASTFFSKDGKTLGIRCSGNRGSASPCIRLYDFPSGKEKRSITTEDKSAAHVACFSPTGQVVFATYQALRVWDAKGNRELAKVKLAGTPRTLAVSPDGKTIAVHWYQGAVTLVRPAASPQVVTTNVKASTPSVLTFSPDGKELWFAPPDAAVVAIDPKTGKQTRQIIPYDGRPSTGVFSARGDWLVRFARGQVITVHDMRTGKETPTFDDHRDGSPVEAVPSPDSSRVATQSPSAVRIHELRSGKMLHCIQGKDFVPGLRWSADGKGLVVARRAGKLCWYDLPNGKRERQADLPSGGVLEASLLPGGKRASCIVEDSKRNRRLIVLDLAAPRGPFRYAAETFGNGWPALSPDGSRALQLEGEKTARLRLVDTGTGKTVWQQPIENRDGAAIFSPDGSRVAILAGGKPLCWETATGRRLRSGVSVEKPTLQGPQLLCLSPDGRTAVIGGELLRTFRRPGVIATFPIVGTWVRLVETATGQVRRELPLVPRVSGAMFTADGTCLITSSIDGSALVWNLAEYAIRPVPAQALDDLGAANGHKAFAAMWSLTGDPQRALRLLAPNLGAARVDAKQVRGWLDALDSESFAKREQAEGRLAALQEHVEDDLLAALAGASLEARTRLRRLLQRLDKGSPEQ